MFFFLSFIYQFSIKFCLQNASFSMSFRISIFDLLLPALKPTEERKYVSTVIINCIVLLKKGWKMNGWGRRFFFMQY